MKIEERKAWLEDDNEREKRGKEIENFGLKKKFSIDLVIHARFAFFMWHKTSIFIDYTYIWALHWDLI